MADITMCTGENCERKEECYRYTAPVNPHWQAYFVKPPLTREGCKMFWKTAGDDHELRYIENWNK